MPSSPSAALRNGRRFLLASHRTEFVSTTAESAKTYKTIARYPKPGEKAVCEVREVQNLLGKQQIACSLGLEPSRILFTTNCVIWVEGPSDVIYWRFWLENSIAQRNLRLIEGADYCFMHTAGSNLAALTHEHDSHQLDLMHVIGASLFIVDTDFNPEEATSPRITQAQIEALPSKAPGNLLTKATLPHFKPRVQKMFEAVEQSRERQSLSKVIATWGREAENALTDDAFQRTLQLIYSDYDDATGHTVLDTVVVDDWASYETAVFTHILSSGEDYPGFIEITKDGKREAMQRSVVSDKVKFAGRYVEAHRSTGVGSNLRPQATKVVAEVLDWIQEMKAQFHQ